MALSVAPVNNPTFTGVQAPNNPQHISGVIVATPGSNGFAGLSQPSAPSTQTQPTNNQAPAQPTVNNTAGTAGYGMNQAEYLQGIQQEYGNSITGAQNQINAMNSYLPTEQGDINNTANASVAQANQQAQDTINQLHVQGANTRQQQQLSLAELADQIHGQNQGLLNQLGAVGAGFSSAANTGQQALAHAQNMQATNINTQANQNLANLNANEKTTNDTLTTAVQGINAWKQQQLDSILNNYSTVMSQLNAALGQAQGEEKARLAMYGQQISASAANALGNLQSVTQNAINNASQQVAAAHNAQSPVAQFQQFQAPQAITYQASSPFAAQHNSNATASPTVSDGSAPGSLAGLAGVLKNQNQ